MVTRLCVLRKLGVSLFLMSLLMAENRSESPCADLLKHSQPIERSTLWDVMSARDGSGDWVALPTDQALIFRHVVAGPAARPQQEFQISWNTLGVPVPPSSPLSSFSGAFIESLQAYLFHQTDAQTSQFYLISLRDGQVSPLGELLEHLGPGKWTFVGEASKTGELFFQRRASGAHAGLLVRLAPQSDSSKWSVTRLVTPLTRTQEVQNVQSVQGGKYLLLGVRGRGLLLIDARTQAVVQELSEAQMETFLRSHGAPEAERSRFFWERIHISSDGNRIAWGISRMAQRQFLPPVAFVWDLEQGSDLRGLSFGILGSAPADVYDWVFADSDDQAPAVYVFGTQWSILPDRDLSESVLYRWSYRDRNAAPVLMEGHAKTPYVFSGCEMECRLQRDLMRHGWLLTSDHRALSPQGHWVDLPVGEDFILSWSLFKPGIYVLRRGTQGDLGLHWIPLPQMD